MAVARRQRRPAALAAVGAGALLAAVALQAAGGDPWRGLLPPLSGGGAGLLAVAAVWRLAQLRRQGGRRLLGRALREAGLTLALLSALAAAALAASRWPVRFDLTADATASLTPATRRVLESLPGEIEGAAFFTRQTAGERRLFVDLLAAYRQHAPDVRIRVVEADVEPEVARVWEVRRAPQVVLRRGQIETRFSIISEEAFSNALLRVCRPRRPVVAFTTGHGEADPDDAGRGGGRELADFLRARAYRVRRLNVAETGAVPPDVDAVLVARPETPFTAAEVAGLEEWLAGGGRLLVLREPQQDSGLDGLLARHGIVAGRGIVVEPDAAGRVAGGSAFVPLGADYGFHPITADFGLNTFWPLAGVMEPASDLPAGVDAAVLVRSSDRAWEEAPDGDGMEDGPPALDPGTDRPGPLPLAVAASSEEAGWRLVACGSGLLAGNGGVGLGGNADFLAAAIDWLAGQEDPLRLPPRPARLTPLTLTAAEERWIFWTSVAGVPLLVALLGVSLGWRRRQL